jgi:hypothetical protein
VQVITPFGLDTQFIAGVCALKNVPNPDLFLKGCAKNITDAQKACIDGRFED